MKAVVLAVGFAVGLGVTGAALAQVPAGLPGVGYDPHALGFNTTYFILDNLNNPFTPYRADFTALPGAAGAVPNDYFFNLADPAVRGAYERRWGTDTAGPRFKRWAGPGNEVRYVVENALVYMFTKHPERLGGSTAGRNGKPTLTEITDGQAFNDTQLINTYLQEALPGYAPERRATVCDPSKPPGDGEGEDPFWGIMYYYHNLYTGQPPVSPAVPPSVVCAQHP